MKLRPAPARWILATALCLGVLPGSPSGALAQGPAARPSATLAGFWGADAAQVRAQLELVPLDPDREVDRALLELMEDLETHQVTDVVRYFSGLETALGWGSQVGSLVHPGLGIALDRRIQRALERASKRERILEALGFLLAHQLAHMMQLQTYTLESLTRTSNLRRMEAQADILTGITLAQNRIFPNRGWDGFRPDLERGIQLAKVLGHPRAYAPLQLRDQERRHLVRIGAEVGLFYSQAWTCITNVGEPGGEGHVRGAVKATSHTHQVVARIFSGGRKAEPSFPPRPKSLAMPRFNPRSCESEDVFDWTSRAAAIAIGTP